MTLKENKSILPSAEEILNEKGIYLDMFISYSHYESVVSAVKVSMEQVRDLTLQEAADKAGVDLKNNGQDFQGELLKQDILNLKYDERLKVR